MTALRIGAATLSLGCAPKRRPEGGLVCAETHRARRHGRRRTGLSRLNRTMRSCREAHAAAIARVPRWPPHSDRRLELEMADAR
ncbi:hypothetical protein RSPO_m00492 (plasmid) [Ralstonia solanacearum Po82]|uniref:Uncharacterized protein n=1 Tax=Ralstonia solanacearum (strain Po82) TaxID=1031711 RepID=F6G9P6_RALS8|nr:hypothetical protein RSPO_m00492 [Ralstonia solanacearum Po82]